MHEIKKVLMNELYEYEEKLKKMPNTRVSQQDLDRVHKLSDTVKNFYKIDAFEEDEYSEADEWMGEGRSYGGSYEGGGSYERGGSYARGRGRNAKRDRMGRYSSEGGYSEGNSYRGSYAREGRGYSRAEGGEYMVEQLEDMLEDAPSPKMREAIKRCISEVKQG